jgi:hypothetical protein
MIEFIIKENKRFKLLDNNLCTPTRETGCQTMNFSTEV